MLQNLSLTNNVHLEAPINDKNLKELLYEGHKEKINVNRLIIRKLA